MSNGDKVIMANIAGLAGAVVVFIVFGIGAVMRMENPEYVFLPLPIPYVIGWIYAEKISRWLDD